MKELIDSILKAEAEAETIIATAKQKATEILEQTAQEVLLIKATAEQDAKEDRRNALTKANQQADTLYADRLKAADAEGSKQKQNAAKNTQKTADFVVGRILA